MVNIDTHSYSLNPDGSWHIKPGAWGECSPVVQQATQVIRGEPKQVVFVNGRRYFREQILPFNDAYPESPDDSTSGGWIDG